MKVDEKIQALNSRRDFIKTTGVLGSILPFAPQFILSGSTEGGRSDEIQVNVFSKHLQFLDYGPMGTKAAELGFDGVDLTVRPGGHVLPENVERDLPKAVSAIKNAGLKWNTMVTRISNPLEPDTEKILKTAADEGVEYYRTGYYSYREGKPVPEDIMHFQNVTYQLGELNRELGIIGCYQNHAGRRMGASIWELWDLMKESDRDYFGAQYDIRHAVVEGGLSWQSGLQLIHPRIQTIVIKDFVWGQKQGEWEPVNVPFGEGMVDFKKYFGILKNLNINVPVSMHFEYPLGGAEHGGNELSPENQERVFAAMKRDLDNLRKTWKEA